MRPISSSTLGTEGSALVEFAIVLPLLVVFLVGIYDFSGAFNQRQKIEHAAQEGAVVAGAQPTTDLDPGNPNPDSLRPVLQVVFSSLVTNNVVPDGPFSNCTVTPAHVSGLKWSYSLGGCAIDPIVIVIDRGWVPTGLGPPVTVGTQIQVSYPYHWHFNSVIQLLVPGASYAAITNLNEAASVHNQM